MKHIIISLLAFNTFAIPIINRPEHVTVHEQAYANEVEFWCDCGVSIHWRELPMKRI